MTVFMILMNGSLTFNFLNHFANISIRCVVNINVRPLTIRMPPAEKSEEFKISTVPYLQENKQKKLVKKRE